jgi:hypothetical protein
MRTYIRPNEAMHVETSHILRKNSASTLNSATYDNPAKTLSTSIGWKQGAGYMCQVYFTYRTTLWKIKSLYSMKAQPVCCYEEWTNQIIRLWWSCIYRCVLRWNSAWSAEHIAPVRFQIKYRAIGNHDETDKLTLTGHLRYYFRKQCTCRKFFWQCGDKDNFMTRQLRFRQTRLATKLVGKSHTVSRTQT